MFVAGNLVVIVFATCHVCALRIFSIWISYTLLYFVFILLFIIFSFSVFFSWLLFFSFSFFFSLLNFHYVFGFAFFNCDIYLCVLLVLVSLVLWIICSLFNAFTFLFIFFGYSFCFILFLLVLFRASWCLSLCGETRNVFMLTLFLLQQKSAMEQGGSHLAANGK